MSVAHCNYSKMLAVAIACSSEHLVVVVGGEICCHPEHLKAVVEEGSLTLLLAITFLLFDKFYK